MRTPRDQDKFLEHGRFGEGLRNPQEVKARVKAVLILGGLAYLISFFLPGVAPEHGGSLAGWNCALAALQFPTFFLSGLINPLLLVYLSLLAASKPRARAIRRGVAIVIMALLPLNVFELVAFKMGIEIGFFVWTAGLVAMTGEDVLHTLDAWGSSKDTYQAELYRGFNAQ